MSNQNVTASVGEPTPLPKRPTLYIVIMPGQSQWISAWPFETMEQAKRHIADCPPGSVIVTIPAEGTSGAEEHKCKACQGEPCRWMDLRRDGDCAVAEYRVNGKVVATIREPLDSNFSHGVHVSLKEREAFFDKMKQGVPTDEFAVIAETAENFTKATPPPAQPETLGEAHQIANAIVSKHVRIIGSALRHGATELGNDIATALTSARAEVERLRKEMTRQQQSHESIAAMLDHPESVTPKGFDAIVQQSRRCVQAAQNVLTHQEPTPMTPEQAAEGERP